MQYLRAFVIGSSFAVFILYFLLVMQTDQKRYSYETYTAVAPLALGLGNALALWVSNRYGINRRKRYFLLSLIAPACVALFAFFTRAYVLTVQGWFRYVATLYLLYFFVCNVVLYELDRLV